MCGHSISKVRAADPDVKYKVQSQLDRNGNMVRNISLDYPGGIAIPSQEKMADNIKPFEPARGNSLRSVLNHCPNTPTDLNLDLGMGRSRLNFSDMSFENVHIESAFSDVMITYDSPNKVEMKHMDIHAIRAKVVLKNIEYARAELISIQNDMGDTRLLIGDNLPHNSTIVLQSAMGGCTLVVDKDQPVRIIFKGGMFTSLDIQPLEAFVQKTDEPNTYVNKAYLQNSQNTFNIICNIDLGTIIIMEQ